MARLEFFSGLYKVIKNPGKLIGCFEPRRHGDKMEHGGIQKMLRYLSAFVSYCQKDIHSLCFTVSLWLGGSKHIKRKINSTETQYLPY